jgi:hypothetical protein
MWEALFDNPWLKFTLIFFLVLVLIPTSIWLLRRVGAERLGLGSVGGRGRQVRLAVIEDVEISARRRLILIRRDNVEHLLMIGGPTDLVVEPNIVRAAAQREAAPPARAPSPPVAEPSPRAAPLGDGGLWPLQPEAPAPRPRIPHPAAPPAPAPEEAEPELASAPPPPPRRQLRAVDPLAGLAAELSRPGDAPRAPADPGHGTFVPREPAVPREPVRPREAAREREAPIEREGREPIRAEREPETPVRAREPAREREEPEFEPPPLRVREPVRAREREAPREAPIEREIAQVPAPAATLEAEFNAAADQNLADMAQRLEAALRRPAKVNEARPADGATRAMTAELAAQRAPVVAHPRAAAPAPHAPTPPAEPKPGKSVYDSLEKEMASLLGRPSGKS